MEVHYVYTYEDSIMKPTNECLKKGEWGGNGNIMEGVNLFRVCCMCVEWSQWNPLTLLMHANWKMKMRKT
jgi:hypothetical protein